jgi:hypothetical protein
MSITFPREMPAVGQYSHSFEIRQVDYMSPETGGRIGAVAAGFPLWRLRLVMNNMLPRQADIWRSWILAQRGARRLFLGYDPSRIRPRLHQRGAIGGPASSWSQSIDAEGNAVLALEGMLPGLALSLGDYVGFRWDAPDADPGTFGRRALVRVVEAAQAGAGGTISVRVEPAVPNVVPSGAEAHLDRPSCLMRLVPGSTEIADQMLGGAWTLAGTKIEAVQDLLP